MIPPEEGFQTNQTEDAFKWSNKTACGNVAEVKMNSKNHVSCKSEHSFQAKVPELKEPLIGQLRSESPVGGT